MDRTEYNELIKVYESELIISPEYIAASSIIDLNINKVKIIPYIIEAQKLRLEPLIGTKLTRELQENDRPFHIELLATDYVYDTLLHWALAAYYQVAAYQIAEGGIYRHQPTDADPLTRGEINGLIKNEEYKAKQFSRRLLDFLCTYSSVYPEYTDGVGDGIKASNRQKFVGGLMIEMGLPTYSEIKKDESIFNAELFWGNNDEQGMGFDETTLSEQSNRIEPNVTAQPVNDWFWIVCDTEVKIQQLGIDIPLGSFDDADELTQVFVKGEFDSKHWIRINIKDTYENAVTFQLKQV